MLLTNSIDIRNLIIMQHILLNIPISLTKKDIKEFLLLKYLISK